MHQHYEGIAWGCPYSPIHRRTISIDCVGRLASAWEAGCLLDALLAVAVGLSAWGLHVFVEDSYRYQTEPHYRKVQRMAVFFVPLLQWALVLLVGTTLLVWHQSSLDTSPAISAEQSGQPEPQMTSDLES